MVISREVIGARLTGMNTPPAKVTKTDNAPKRDSSQGIHRASSHVSFRAAEPRSTQFAFPVVSLSSATPSVTAAPAVPFVSCPSRPGTPTGSPIRDGSSASGNLQSLREKFGKFATSTELARVNALSTEGMIDTFLEGLTQVKSSYSSFFMPPVHARILICFVLSCSRFLLLRFAYSQRPSCMVS